MALKKIEGLKIEDETLDEEGRMFDVVDHYLDTVEIDNDLETGQVKAVLLFPGMRRRVVFYGGN